MRIFSIFQSINGEVNVAGMGSMTTFVRFAGCSANCDFCDTLYAKDHFSGTDMSVDEVLHEVAKQNCNNVMITGGEPMEQKSDLYLLLHNLVENGYRVTVETNGEHLFHKQRFPCTLVNWVVDIKPKSDTMSRYIEMNLGGNDYLKQVVGSKEQFEDAILKKNVLQAHGVRAVFAFSPEYGKVTPDELVMWMKDAGQHDAVLNIQLHKILNLTEAN